jgi:hypothetical protein
MERPLSKDYSTADWNKEDLSQESVRIKQNIFKLLYDKSLFGVLK